MSGTGIVTFDYATWVARYPEFTAVTEPVATLYFGEAGIYLDNTGGSAVQDFVLRAALLNMLTAHIAALNNPVTAQGGNQLVGRIASAAEGSVNIQAVMDGVPGSAAWFMQTKYGAAYWQATLQFRTMHYFPRPRCGFPLGISQRLVWPRW